MTLLLKSVKNMCQIIWARNGYNVRPYIGDFIYWSFFDRLSYFFCIFLCNVWTFINKMPYNMCIAHYRPSKRPYVKNKK